MSPPTWRIEVPPDGRDAVLLALPSAARAFGSSCEDAAPGTGVLVGLIADAEFDTALAGARVHARWSELSVSGTGIRQVWRYRRATTGPDGRYLLCGLPGEGGNVLLWATRDSASTGQIVVELRGALLESKSLLLSPRPAAPGRVEGIVRTAEGIPILGARVLVRRGKAMAETDPSGRFAVDLSPTGSQVLEVAAIGFEPTAREIALRPGRVTNVEVVVTQAPQVLPALLSVGRLGKGRAASTFLERSKRGFGYYITAEQIERRPAFAVEDLLQGIPGLRVIRSIGGYRVESSRASGFSGSCSPRVYVDGSNFPFLGEEGDQIPVPVSDVAGIEVYPGLAGAPIEFEGGGCGVIAIWTKESAMRGEER